MIHSIGTPLVHEDCRKESSQGIGEGIPEGYLDLFWYEDDEGKSLAHIVVREIQRLELIPVLEDIKTTPNTPSFLVETEDSLCKGGFEDEDTEGAFLQLKPL